MCKCADMAGQNNRMWTPCKLFHIYHPDHVCFLEIKSQAETTWTPPVTQRITPECFHSKDLHCTSTEWVAEPSSIVHYKVTVVQKIAVIL